MTTVPAATRAECFVCAKHRAGDQAEGGVLYVDDLVYAGHVHTMDSARAYQGHLVVEPRRHVEALGFLHDDEAARLGWLTNRVAAALRAELGAEHVFSFAQGGVAASARTPAHLHVHVIPRYPGTPPEYRGARLQRWPEAPGVDADAMRALVVRLRAPVAAPPPPD
jgi:histidine triad (HIT) family protein